MDRFTVSTHSNGKRGRVHDSTREAFASGADVILDTEIHRAVDVAKALSTLEYLADAGHSPATLDVLEELTVRSRRKHAATEPRAYSV